MGINRCRHFLEVRNARAARDASDTINQYLLRLKVTPDIGRLLPGSKSVRELVIPFGNAGYIARYRFDQSADTVVITGVRHQREENF